MSTFLREESLNVRETINVLLFEATKGENSQVIKLLEDFKPTKIAVEVRADHQEKLHEDFQKFLAGDFQLTVVNEIRRFVL